jgi:hypothetical protein
MLTDDDAVEDDAELENGHAEDLRGSSRERHLDERLVRVADVLLDERVRHGAGADDARQVAVLGGVVVAARVRVVRQRGSLGGADAEREQLDDEGEAGEVSARARPERSCQR